MSKAVAGVFALCWLWVASDGLAQSRFQPTAIHILGSQRVGDVLPFTRVVTQKAGELAFSRLEFRDIGLSPNLPKVLEVLRQPLPVASVMTIAFEQTVIRASGVFNLRESRLPTELVGEFIVTEGTTYPIPVGTRLATYTSHASIEHGTSVLTTVLSFTPGLLPDVTPTSLSLCGQQTPELVRNPRRPGLVSIETTFTSVRPEDGSDPLVHRTVQRVPIVENPS